MGVRWSGTSLGCTSGRRGHEEKRRVDGSGPRHHGGHGPGNRLIVVAISWLTDAIPIRKAGDGVGEKLASLLTFVRVCPT